MALSASINEAKLKLKDKIESLGSYQIVFGSVYDLNRLWDEQHISQTNRLLKRLSERYLQKREVELGLKVIYEELAKYMAAIYSLKAELALLKKAGKTQKKERRGKRRGLWSRIARAVKQVVGI